MENKKRKRKVVSFTIDGVIKEKFDGVIKENHINKSKLIESLIQKFIQENEK